MEWRKIFPERLQGLRKNLGLSKTELARLVGVTNVSILEFEKGRKVPSVDTLVVLGRTLNCSLDYLLGFTDDPTRPPSSQPREDG